ncbi:DUF6950 family protein [Falsirhodobacter halotolerans]|uniref:DUF6950 family protein n=1 Tax=Falsirhodobacter halotolerans TaxID=1146892 RepID=UPI001FD4FD24|nr:hypothetical protein [Falsirhodobacter halotolerans]MCJ8138611.1 hypothetical protein [Falsirhodobacter halotolerans]
MIMLHRYLAASAREPFAYGQHDCATFAARWVEIRTGRDISDGLIGRYTTMRDGLRIMRGLGLVDHVAFFARALPRRDGLPRVGDLVAVAGLDGPAMGIWGGEAAHHLGETGLVALPLSQVTDVFEVSA